MKLNYSDCLSITDDKQKANIDQSRLGSIDDYNLITHGHTDHISISNQKTITTKETSALISVQTGRQMDYCYLNGKPMDVTDNLWVEGINAGHILGSKMFYFETKDSSLLYTGDFRSRDSMLLYGAVPRQADILVIETTFGKKEYSFPEREKVYCEFSELIQKDISKNKLVLIGAYSLGKTQEIIKFVNKYLGETPVVTKKGYAFSKVYEDFGVSLGSYDLLEHNLENHNILIAPMNLINHTLIKSVEHQLGKAVSSYLATGWKHYKSGKCIPISDHCDYNDLMDFVRQVNPKKVFTMHGFAEDFSKSITKELGIWARPITELNQKQITDLL